MKLQSTSPYHVPFVVAPQGTKTTGADENLKASFSGVRSLKVLTTDLLSFMLFVLTLALNALKTKVRQVAKRNIKKT